MLYSGIFDSWISAIRGNRKTRVDREEGAIPLDNSRACSVERVEERAQDDSGFLAVSVFDRPDRETS